MAMRLIGAALFLVFLMTGAAMGDFIGQGDKEVQAVADPILDNLLAGFNEDNYKKYSKDFNETLKEVITEKKFAEVRGSILTKLGKYQSHTYLGFLNQGRMTAILYKGKFVATQDDVLIKLVLSKRQGGVVVTGLWFQ